MTEERIELQGEFTAKAHATWHISTLPSTRSGEPAVNAVPPEDKKEEEEKEKEEEKAK